MGTSIPPPLPPSSPSSSPFPSSALSTLTNSVAAVGATVNVPTVASIAVPISLGLQARPPSPSNDVIFVGAEGTANESSANTSIQPGNHVRPEKDVKALLK